MSDSMNGRQASVHGGRLGMHGSVYHLMGRLQFLVGIVLAISVVITVSGVWKHAAELRPLWNPESWIAIAWAAGAMVVWMGLGWLLRLPPRLMLVVLPLLTAASTLGLGPTVAAALVFFSAMQIGLLVLPRKPRGIGALLMASVAIAIGLAVAVLLLQMFARLPVHHRLFYVVLLVLPFAWMPSRAHLTWRAIVQTMRSQWGADGWTIALWAIAIAGSLIRFLGVFAPEAGMDALGVHLQMPAMVERDHRWMPAESGFIWAWMPLAVDWIYALAYVLAGESAVRLVNFGADALVMVMCAGVAGRMAGTRAAAFAAVMYSTLPITYLLTTSVFVENMWTLWAAAAVAIATWLHGQPSGPWRGYLALGLVCGAALAAKLMTVFWLPLFALFAWERLRGAGLRELRWLGLSLLAALAVGSWPYLGAWFETGNPVFPFMNAIFKSPLYDTTSSFQSNFHEPLRPSLLYDLTFDTELYVEAPTGGFGVLWLAVLPAGLLAALAWGGRWAHRVVAGALFYVLATLAFTSNLRYVASAFPVLAALTAIGYALGKRAWLRGIITVVMMIGGLAGLGLFAHSTWWYRKLEPLGPVDPAAYRDWRRMMRPEADIVEQSNMLGFKHILWVGRPFYAGVQAKVATTSWHGWQPRSGWHQIEDRTQFARWMSRRRFDAIVLGPGIDACATPWLCEFVDTLGPAELQSGDARLYRIPPALLPFVENLQDPDLRGDPPVWNGNGNWDREGGIMRVNRGQVFAQTVPVEALQRYDYRVRVRCHQGSALFLMRVRFMGDTGRSVGEVAEPGLCSTEWTEHQLLVIPPSNAVKAVVYAAGQSEDRDVEIDKVSFRE